MFATSSVGQKSLRKPLKKIEGLAKGLVRRDPQKKGCSEEGGLGSTRSPPAARNLIYTTTNAIQSLHNQFRKIRGTPIIIKSNENARFFDQEEEFRENSQLIAKNNQ